MSPAAKVTAEGKVPSMNSLPVPVKVTVRPRTGAMVLLTAKVALPPSATLPGLTAMDTAGTSLSAMMPVSARVDAPPCNEAFIALERVKVSTSSAASSMLSSVTGTSTAMLVWPAEKVSVPFVAV